MTMLAIHWMLSKPLGAQVWSTIPHAWCHKYGYPTQLVNGVHVQHDLTVWLKPQGNSCTEAASHRIVSCLTLSSADGTMLSIVVTRRRAAPPPPPAAAQHTCTDMPNSTAPPAAAQHTHIGISDSSALADVPAGSDHATLGALTLLLKC